MVEPRKGTTVTIEIQPDGDTYSLALNGYGGRDLLLPDLAGRERLWAMRQTAMEGLAGFKRATVAGRPDAYTDLSNLAIRLLNMLLGDKVNKYVSTFYDFVGESFQKWYATEDTAPRVTLAAPPELMVPIELLAFHGIGRPPSSVGPDPGYYDHLGFAAVVNRSFSRLPDVSESRIILGAPQLPVTFLQNTSLPGSSREAKFLAGNDRIRLDGPWPDGEADISAGKKKVINSLYDPTLPLKGTSTQFAAQIQHLSCHGQFDPRDPRQSDLQLSCPDGKVILTLGYLEQEFTRLRLETKKPTRDVPLVFLNACESAATAGYMSADSFPRHFRDWDSRAVLGVEVAVPDKIAAAFSRLFYEGLLDANLPLGSAVLQARQRLLARNNPLGILYTLYGDPDLVVMPPCPKATR